MAINGGTKFKNHCMYTVQNFPFTFHKRQIIANPASLSLTHIPTEGVVTKFLLRDRFICQLPSLRLLQPPPLARLTGSAQDARDQLHAAQTVIVGGDRVRDPRGVGVRIDDTDRGDVVQAALVQEDDVLERVQADDEVGLQHGPVDQGLLELGELLVQRVDDLHIAVAQDLLAVRQTARDPAFEDVVALGQLRGADDASLLALSGADEQDEASSRGDLLHDLGRTAEVGCCDI